jgi:hypothetical protein
MRAPVDDLRYPGAPGKLCKQAIASIGAVHPTIATGEWLEDEITLTRSIRSYLTSPVDEVLGAKVPIPSILTDARTCG